MNHISSATALSGSHYTVKPAVAKSGDAPAKQGNSKASLFKGRRICSARDILTTTAFLAAQISIGIGVTSNLRDRNVFEDCFSPETKALHNMAYTVFGSIIGFIPALCTYILLDTAINSYQAQPGHSPDGYLDSSDPESTGIVIDNDSAPQALDTKDSIDATVF